MGTHHIDDDIETYLWSLMGKPKFGLDINVALRKALPMGKPPIDSDALLEELKTAPTKTFKPPILRRTRPASLQMLTIAHALKEGQTLYFHDYSGQLVKGQTATIAGSDLMFRGELTSMSKAAALILKELGNTSDSVRGPAHWRTKEGKRISDLWDEYMKRREDRTAKVLAEPAGE